VLGNLEAVKKEVAVDGISVKIDIDNVFAPTRSVFLMDNSSRTVVRNRQFKLAPKEEKQLTAILSVLYKPYRRLSPTRVPLKRRCALESEVEEKKQKDS